MTVSHLSVFVILGWQSSSRSHSRWLCYGFEASRWRSTWRCCTSSVNTYLSGRSSLPSFCTKVFPPWFVFCYVSWYLCKTLRLDVDGEVQRSTIMKLTKASLVWVLNETKRVVRCSSQLKFYVLYIYVWDWKSCFNFLFRFHSRNADVLFLVWFYSYVRVLSLWEMSKSNMDLGSRWSGRYSSEDFVKHSRRNRMHWLTFFLMF